MADFSAFSQRTIKVTHVEDTRRGRLSISAGALPAEAFATIQAIVAALFDLPESAMASYLIKYLDEDGDLCTLTERTMPGFALVAPQGVVRLSLTQKSTSESNETAEGSEATSGTEVEVTYDGETRRGSIHIGEPFSAIQDTIASLFDIPRCSMMSFQIKYLDEDGDACTLTEYTVPDFIVHAAEGLVKMTLSGTLVATNVTGDQVAECSGPAEDAESSTDGSRQTSNMSVLCSGDAFYMTSHRRQQLMDSHGKVRMSENRKGWEVWTCTSTRDGKFRIMGHFGTCPCGQKNCTGDWAIADAGDSQVFLTHDENQQLQDHHGKPQLTHRCEAWERWTLTRLDGIKINLSTSPCATLSVVAPLDQAVTTLSAFRTWLTGIYHFIRCGSTGNVLACKGGSLVSSTVADDDCMWFRVRGVDGSESFCSVVCEIVLEAERTTMGTGLWLAPREHASCFYLFHGGVRLSANACSEGEPAVYTVVDGPRKLPSKHVKELKQDGYTVVENIIPADSVAAIKDVVYREGPSAALTKTPIVARLVAQPVADYILGEYLGDYYLGHQPIVTKRPGQNSGGCWHTDHGAALFEGRPQGAQFNVCVDEFREDNAATQFLPGSHAYGSIPAEWNSANHLKGGHGNSVDPRVRHMLAPAGAGIIYDARTWHRACPEYSRCPYCDPSVQCSGGDRIAILNAVTTRRYKPFMDKESEAERFRNSAIPAMLTQRERDVVKRLCLQNESS